MRGARFSAGIPGQGASSPARVGRPGRFGGYSRQALVGASILQTPGGIQSEMEKIDTEIKAHDAELRGAVAATGFDLSKVSIAVSGFLGDMWEGIKDVAIPGHAVDKAANEAIDQAAERARAAHQAQQAAQAVAHAPPLAQFYVTTWLPWMRQWQRWYQDNNGWWSNFWWNHAPDAEGYQRKLLDMRKAAESLGMHWTTPHPDIEGKSIMDPRNPGPADAIPDLGKLLKYAGYGALALGGAWGLAQVISAARGR